MAIPDKPVDDWEMDEIRQLTLGEIGTIPYKDFMRIFEIKTTTIAGFDISDLGVLRGMLDSDENDWRVRSYVNLTLEELAGEHTEEINEIIGEY